MPLDIPARDLAAHAALASHTGGDGTALISLTDEDLLALGAASSVDLPWIDAREGLASGFSRDEARLTATRSLIARALLAPESAFATLEGREPDGDPQRYVPATLVTGILTRRRLAPLEVRLDGPVRDRVSIVRLFVDPDGPVLQELVSPDGIHHFAMSDVPHAASLATARLAAGADPASPAPTREAITGSWEEIEASATLGPLVRGATTRSRVRVADRRTGSTRSMLVAAGPDGLVVVHERDDSTLTATRYGPSELAALVTSLLAPPVPA